jgi:hypothetical protein
MKIKFTLYIAVLLRFRKIVQKCGYCLWNVRSDEYSIVYNQKTALRYINKQMAAFDKRCSRLLFYSRAVLRSVRKVSIVCRSGKLHRHREDPLVIYRNPCIISGCATCHINTFSQWANKPPLLLIFLDPHGKHNPFRTLSRMFAMLEVLTESESIVTRMLGEEIAFGGLDVCIHYQVEL